MSLTLAIARGALDIAHGFYRGVSNWFSGLWDRILDRLGVALAQFELSELIGITEKSRFAANLLWQGNQSINDIPLAEPPHFGTPDGTPYGNYQVKIISRVFDSGGNMIERSPFYMEFNGAPDKISIEEYIRQFWLGVREFGNDTIGTTFVDIGTIRNVPIYLVRRT